MKHDFPYVTSPAELAGLILKRLDINRTTVDKDDWNNLVKNCWDILNRDVKDGIEKPSTFKAKVLVFDIETAPLLVYVWRRWKQNVFSDQALEDNWPILTWSAKWLFEEEIMSMKMTPEEALNRDDRRVVHGLWRLINEADIVIAHNGLKFDMKMMNGRFWIHGLEPPSTVEVIDTLKSAKKMLGLPSYKLDDLAKYLNKEGKIKTDFSWWSEFLEGNPEAIDRMQEYNDKDVTILEEVYFSLRPWIKPHPNLGLHIGEDIKVCPTCASEDLQYIGKYATYVNMYEELRCNSCGALSRSRKNGNLRERKELLSSLPR